MARLCALIQWMLGKRSEVASPTHEQVLRRLLEQEARLRALDAQASTQKAANKR